MLDQLVAERLLDVRGPRAEAGDAVDHIDQGEAIEVVFTTMSSCVGVAPSSCSRERPCGGSSAGM